jgi:hypothetical protein
MWQDRLHGDFEYSRNEEKTMKNEKTKPDTMKPVEEKAADKDATAKKKKKNKKGDETPAAAPKVKKAKPEKTDKKAAEPKSPKPEKAPKAPKTEKAPKDDKPTKFLVSMKKSLRKNVKKEAAEAGISMNDYIVLAVTEKLGNNPPEASKAPLKKP